MRAILVKDGKGHVENLYLGEAEKPVPGQGNVLVKVKFFGLNRMDILQREGHYPLPPGASSILGVEFSGHVEQVGEGVTEWYAGDEVLGLAAGLVRHTHGRESIVVLTLPSQDMFPERSADNPYTTQGAYAEYIIAPRGNIIRKPAHLSWAEAASIPEVFLTAFQALVVLAEVKKGDDVLIHAGASGVGIAAIQLARLYGANTVTATASTKDKLDMLLQLPSGATHVVNYKEQDFSAEVKKTTGGKGVDIIIDFVGQSHWNKNIDSLAYDGRMTMLAFLSGAEVEKFNLAPILYKRLRIQGSTLRARSESYQADLVARFKKEAFDHITGASGDGKVRTYIHKVYPWTEIQEAHREMEANNNSGKIIVEIV
ncbi:quinone oxidoreductase [Dichomitus squalens LYAD-421 SS1]|uniref:Quinone oxidoreductase n=1 Tax=Dichomitus squalens (strain LYAD-421) TaxID=732165 RepID=R7SY06_DICSQ|nr:quinone oxidoreductase [Dichomitus squalens LYAD-421 SS1]EJF60976.1 quinone oxidoreductase [Dichomitus squalens LYAD-421 SS1]